MLMFLFATAPCSVTLNDSINDIYSALLLARKPFNHWFQNRVSNSLGVLMCFSYCLTRQTLRYQPDPLPNLPSYHMCSKNFRSWIGLVVVADCAQWTVCTRKPIGKPLRLTYASLFCNYGHKGVVVNAWLVLSISKSPWVVGSSAKEV